MQLLMLYLSISINFTLGKQLCTGIYFTILNVLMPNLRRKYQYQDNIIVPVN